jgi:hypothetical protein
MTTGIDETAAATEERSGVVVEVAAMGVETRTESGSALIATIGNTVVAAAADQSPKMRNEIGKTEIRKTKTAVRKKVKRRSMTRNCYPLVNFRSTAAALMEH